MWGQCCCEQRPGGCSRRNSTRPHAKHGELCLPVTRGRGGDIRSSHTTRSRRLGRRCSYRDTHPEATPRHYRPYHRDHLTSSPSGACRPLKFHFHIDCNSRAYRSVKHSPKDTSRLDILLEPQTPTPPQSADVPPPTLRNHSADTKTYSSQDESLWTPVRMTNCNKS